MTLGGTNTYVVGSDPAWVVDPGPADAGHLAAVREAAAARGGIGGVVLTHSHADHSAGVEALGAPLAWGVVAAADESSWGEPPPPAARQEARVGPFELIPTPGHARDHVCFLRGRVLFCGDLVLGEGSTIVPPAELGGSLSDYMRSLDRARELDAELLAPGHGQWVTEPRAKLDEYAAHRREREHKLVAALERGERERERLLDAAWDDVPAAMRPAAALALQAHLEKLADEGRLPPDTTVA